MIWLIPGFVALIAGIILVAPFFLALLARVGRKAPIAIRLALRDLSRYRARSGSALSAISVGVLIAVVICAVAVARYSNVFDYVGPNLASNELAVWSPNGQNGNSPNPSAPTPQDIESQEASVHAIASAVGATDVVELDNPAPSIGLQNPSASGRQWDGQIYVATPALLRAYGINPSSIPSDVDVLSSRPGLSGSGVQLTYGGGGGKGGGQLVGPGSGGPDGGGGPGPGNTNTCSPGGCIAHPVVQEESQLPTGTDAPNTVITESALRRLHLASQSSLDGWIIQANSPITSAQITNAQALAATDNLSIESKNDAPTSHEIVNWATVFAIALALGILAMSIGLIRSETASELRTLTATGASSRTRRTLTAVTAGGLAFLGALLGTVAAYVGLAGWFHSNALEGGLSDIIDHIPWSNLFLIVIAMPVVAAIVGWVLAGRDPTGSPPARWSRTRRGRGRPEYPLTGRPGGVGRFDRRTHMEFGRFGDRAAASRGIGRTVDRPPGCMAGPKPLGGPSRPAVLGRRRPGHAAASACEGRLPHRRRPRVRRPGGRPPGPAAPDHHPHDDPSSSGPGRSPNGGSGSPSRTFSSSFSRERPRVGNRRLGPGPTITAAPSRAIRQVASRLRDRPRHLPVGRTSGAGGSACGVRRSVWASRVARQAMWCLCHHRRTRARLAGHNVVRRRRDQRHTRLDLHGLQLHTRPPVADLPASAPAPAVHVAGGADGV